MALHYMIEFEIKQNEYKIISNNLYKTIKKYQ
jgi:hypothetical protein